MPGANEGHGGSRQVSSGAPLESQIGTYRILDRLGEGGMGTVYVAEQQEPVKRRVALKVIKLGMDSKAVVARFEQERQALAMMDHEGIAKVYDCGTTDRGQPFFAMEYVQGVPLDRYCDDQRLSLKDRLQLMRQVCAAVQHAHHKGVVHRDLKPGNVLVSDDGGKRSVKVIDFGLAKAMGAKLVEATLFTEAGQIVGTPEYMAPEQADPTNLNIDTRADVYSLGVMLYQLLCGELPFPGAELRAAGMLEVQRILREVEPPKPSTRITKLGVGAAPLAESRRVSLSALKKALVGDLDWVVLKALEKERNRRYETANALSSDLQRYLDDEPLVAGPPSAGYRLKKLVRRYRIQAFAGSAVLLTAVLGAGVAVRFAMLAGDSERLANLRAVENAKLAEERSALAFAEGQAKAVAQRTVSHFNQLAAYMRLEAAVEKQEQMWPAWPEHVAAMEAWLANDCAQLLALRPTIESTIAELRTTTGFPDLKDETSTFLRGALTNVLDGLDALARTQKLDVEQRLSWARQVQAATFAHPKARVTWSAVRESIAKADDVVASKQYSGAVISLPDEAVLGLVPIGMNPKTKLWEFYDLRSAWDGRIAAADIEIPRHGPDGSIEVEAHTGIVFVLLPGGRTTLGSQSVNPSEPFYCSESSPNEVLHDVYLNPFLLARHEMTQGQWARLCSWDARLRTPSCYSAGEIVPMAEIDWTNPVEQVTWVSSVQLLQRHGMVLPTEAQWEYGCRGGTTTPWTVTLEDLGKVANIADADAKRAARGWTCESWSDGHVVHAPVGSFKANAFGLHDVHGNVWEWCSDEWSDYGGERDGDGARPRSGLVPRYCVYRGGSFYSPAGNARSAYRYHLEPSNQVNNLGLRPARTVAR